MSSSISGTGIAHWWTYEERAIPGIGKAMVNVGTGNFLVSAMDVDIPEQGIDLAFRRVYNSQSLHDYTQDDGGDSAIFGNRWTNNFDANIVYNPNANPVTLTVYDLNGTACTYTSNGDGTWKPCTGEYAILEPLAGSNNCTYAWIKPNGTTYLFNTDITGSGCSIQQAKKGHLSEIEARNQNNYITFSYTYNGSGHGSSDILEIDANHSDGDELKMAFGIIPGTHINELKTITRPDGAILNYLYDTSGNLLEVDKPGNNSAKSIPSPPPTLPTGDVPETYVYVSQTSTLQEACGPRCTISIWNGTNNDGSMLLFSVDGSMHLTSWQVNGVLNFTPDDQTNTILQSGISAAFRNWYTADFVYGAVQNSPCGTTNASTTTMCDTDGHSTIWTTNSAGSVTQAQESTGVAEGIFIVTLQEWDPNNNLISTTDANGNKTKYAYDTPGNNQGGNMVEMQLPNATDISNGPLSPLSYYSYDTYNNVISYCDPVYTQKHGKSWVDSPGDNLCPANSTSGAPYFQYNLNDTQYEPYGCLTDIYKAGEYHTKITFPNTPGPCGAGLPSKTQGDQITNYDNTQRTPTQDFGYDSRGNLTSYDRGTDGTNTLDSWTLTYNADNFDKEKTQNDPTITNAAIHSFNCYYPDGSLLYTETPSQHDADGNHDCPSTQSLLNGGFTPYPEATTYFYDTDGDQVKLFTYKGCSVNTACLNPSQKTACVTGESNPSGTTCKYYDGLDRLVETIEPWDHDRAIGSQPYEFYGFRWMNRYIYDLSGQGGSGNLKISDTTGAITGLVAYGNLYKTQEYLPTQASNKIGVFNDPYFYYSCPCGPYTSGGWSDVRGTSFDGLDRTVSKYELGYGTTAVTTNTYDQPGEYDLLSNTINAVLQKTSYTYDSIARVQEIDFSGTAPLADTPRTYTYDADGRTQTITNSIGTITYTYDVDGNKVSVNEPANEHAASLICYNYYGDGLREYLSITVAGGDCNNVQNQIPSNGGISQKYLFSYAYTTDNMLFKQLVTWGSNSPQTFKWEYTPSERETKETDPLNGTQPSGFAEIQPKTYSYDQYGRVAQLTLPEGYNESSFVYDYDDELASYSFGGQGGSARYLTLNVRGELLEDNTSSTLIGWSQGPTFSANGAQVGDGDTTQFGTVEAPPTTLQYDVRTNMAKCIADPQWASEGGTNHYDWTYSYDLAGRQVNAGPDTSGTCTGGGGFPTSYDAENHIQNTHYLYGLNIGNGETKATVSWGPDGHQRTDELFDSSNLETDYTAHWDGDTMLFSTYAPSDPTLYIGQLGVMDSAGDMLVLDRDQTGTQQSSHGNIVSGSRYLPTGPWYTGLTTGTVRNVYVAKSGKQLQLNLMGGSCNYFDSHNNWVACPLFAATFAMSRSDGYAMVGGLVQGARTFDPTNGQWLTPDPYAGDVHNPMSQKPFMWNNNNPVQWSDPTGYDPVVVPADMQALWTWAKAASSKFKQLATDIAHIKGARVVISETRVQHATCGCYGNTHQTVVGGHVVGPITIHLTREALQSGSTFAGTTGHELTHGLDYSRDANAAEKAKGNMLWWGYNQLEAHAYGNENTINGQVDQYLQNHPNPQGPDAPKAQTPP